MVAEPYVSKRVCVIGAGPSGLVAARELRREGHIAVVFEQYHDIGGQWLYNPNVDGHDPLGPRDPGEFLDIYSGMYDSLRLVSPREMMGFTDLPFRAKKGRDTRRFPGHREVYLYLRDFCDRFGLWDALKLNRRVERVRLADSGVEIVVGKDMKWAVKSREVSLSGGDCTPEETEAVEEIFDAVVVATGHYALPKLPSFKGTESWKRKQLHSHFYRVPHPFRNEVVVIVGNSLSGQDLSMELIKVAKEVHLSVRSMDTVTHGLSKLIANHHNLHLRPQIEALHEDGNVSFVDGSSLIADTLIYCTGYSYSFPFLETKGIVVVEDGRVGPLFEHTFPPTLSPSLSFIGIPKKIIGFPFFESQAKWIAQVLCGKRALPSWDEMMLSINQFYISRDLAAIPIHNTHDISDFEYCDRYGDYTGFPHLEEWRKRLCLSSIVNSIENLETFRDSYEQDEELLQEAFLSPHFTQQTEPQAIPF